MAGRIGSRKGREGREIGADEKDSNKETDTIERGRGEGMLKRNRNQKNADAATRRDQVDSKPSSDCVEVLAKYHSTNGVRQG